MHAEFPCGLGLTDLSQSSGLAPTSGELLLGVGGSHPWRDRRASVRHLATFSRKVLTVVSFSATLCCMSRQVDVEFSLSSARVNRGHTIRSLAAEVGIDYRTLVRLEDGEAIHPAKALKVADYFGVQVTDLMPDHDSKAAA